MPKRNTSAPDDDVTRSSKRKRKNSSDVVWVRDTTLPEPPPPPPPTNTEESTPVPTVHVNVEGNVEIHVGTSATATEKEEEEYEEFLAELLQEYLPNYEEEEEESEAESEKPPPRRSTRQKAEKPAMKLNTKENAYFRSLTPEQQRQFNVYMQNISNFMSTDTEVPLRFQVMKLPVSDFVKANVLKKIAILEEEGGESYKIRNWVDGFLRIPFGNIIPVPVTLADGREKCSAFMRNARDSLDAAVYGLIPAKTHILQVLAQWITNPGSVGNVIGLHGGAGVGKTSLARSGIAEALQRPFEFFSLGGASDIANFTGHSYTYEGSMWGRIVDSLMHAKCMNPVMYFDELDKISTTPHGEEIASMLIHMTDRSQNTQFHDRYFAGVDIDLSQCLFVFSFNDIHAVHPILRDRMQIVHCAGYSEKDKKHILEDYVWPRLIERLKFTSDDIALPDSTMEYLIREYSADEKGVRSLIRAAETIVTRLNMLRIADMRDYKFYVSTEFPMILTPDICKTLLHDASAKEPESWRSMYN